MSPPVVQSIPQKGKGKGKGCKGSPPPPPSASGRGSPPGPPVSTKVGKPDRAADVAEQALFGRKVHWIKPGYNDPPEKTLFRRMSDIENNDLNIEIDNSLLTAMFKDTQKSPRIPGPAGVAPRRSTGKALLDSKRAQNIAIVFGQLKSSTEEVCDQLRAMDFSEPLLSADQVELLLGALPTDEEAKLISSFVDSKEQLRDAERKVLPFCTVPHVDVRLKLLRSAMSHESLYESITSQLSDVQFASKQLMESKLLFKLFAAVLQSGNLVNGAEQTKQKKVKSFAIETLPSICTFKIRETSMMHFLCITLHKSDPCFLQNLLVEIPNLKEAARIKLSALQEEVKAFRAEADSVQRGAEIVRDVQTIQGGSGLESLVAKLHEEVNHLQENMAHAQKVQSAAQTYFGAEGKLPPSEVFFGYFVEFLQSFTEAWREISQNPQKWRQFFDENLEFWENSQAGPRGIRWSSKGTLSPRSPVRQKPQARRSSTGTSEDLQKSQDTEGANGTSSRGAMSTLPSWAFGQTQASGPGKSIQEPQAPCAQPSKTCNIDIGVPKVRGIQSHTPSERPPELPSGYSSPPINFFGSAKGPITPSMPNPAMRSASPTVNLWGVPKKLPPGAVKVLPSRHENLTDRAPDELATAKPEAHEADDHLWRALLDDTEDTDPMTSGVEKFSHEYVEAESTCASPEQTASQPNRARSPVQAAMSRVFDNLRSPRGFNLSSPRSFNFFEKFVGSSKSRTSQSGHSSPPVSLWTSEKKIPKGAFPL
eukprot:gnl/MRDRNA2_/MRDRNA2_122420_c0_seq1.p1 gnl/MRDRNA2_/MRDRNA2_122420_c0~~gnl/MRDRNA2_/MRDRNA2_122420_c0_seq1.p1  ORF type:complete len:762 (-),score=147.13 gnl/MRDRNA2_/MRDRNA2_122420_c0_seq1:75-2360(-)